MQASVLENQHKPYFKKNAQDFHRAQGRLPPPYQPGIMGPIPQATEDNKPRWDDKLSALRAQRRAQGLCMKCGEKWSKQHRCPDKTALHVLKEVLHAMQHESSGEDSKTDYSDEEDE